MDACDGEIDLLIIIIFVDFGRKFGTQNEQNLLSYRECSHKDVSQKNAFCIYCTDEKSKHKVACTVI